MDFDKDEVTTYFIDKLKDKYLTPKPHLNVLNTKYTEPTNVGIFTFSDRPAAQNLIGYDFLVEELNKDAISKTVFEFYVRCGKVRPSGEASNEDFALLKAEILTELDKKHCSLKISEPLTERVLIDKDMELHKDEQNYTFCTEWTEGFGIEYTKFKKKGIVVNTTNNIKLKFTKSVKKEGDTFRVQVRISNENYDNRIKDLSYVDRGIERPLQVTLQIPLDFKISEICEDAIFKREKASRRGTNTAVRRLYNIVPQEEKENEIIFSEYYKGYEKIAKFKVGRNKKEFISYLDSKDLKLSEAVINSFKFTYFYNYQEEGIENILKEIKERRGQINIIQVRTAGGKTETFMVPLLQHCLDNIDKKGVKGLIFYPTKALANDQGYRFFKAIYHLNKIAKGKKIKMGLYHGDIKKKQDEEKEIWIPFKCPNCEDDGKDMSLSFKSSGNRNIAYCTSCKEEFGFLILTRYEAFRELPDILITNQDTLHHAMMESPEAHVIFGREIEYCDNCGTSHINKRVCPSCQSKLILIKPDSPPDIIIMDEIHMLGGAFGINTSLFLKRLESLIKSYSNNVKPHSIVYVGATATIKNPDQFASKLFGNNNIRKIPRLTEGAYDIESERQRVHLFILPKSYDSADTLAYGTKFILDYFKNNDITDRPRILGFCQSIKDNRNLIKLTQSRSPSYKIRGHTSQFEKDRRAEIEKEFTLKKIDVLFATSTLEVGVDFDDVNILLLHGVPYSFNDYLQRVGRSGRKKSAAVITTLRKWSPIDYFYFEQAKAMLENSGNFIVDPPLDTNNTLLKNHIRASIFDYIASLDNTNKLEKMGDLKEFLFNSTDYRPDKLNEIRTYIKNTFSLNQRQEDMMDEILNDFKARVLTPSEINDKWELFDSFNKEYQIGALRTSDKIVEVDFSI